MKATRPLGNEPVIVIGIVFACILAVLQVLVGNGIVGQDVFDTIASAIDPNRGGWLIPIIAALITRLFTSPAEKPGL